MRRQSPPRQLRPISRSKKKIFDDCPAALAEIKELDAESKKDSVAYLKKVLNLQTTQLDDLAAQTPGHTGDVSLHDPSGVEFWRSFQPAREANAKACAVKVLMELGTTALETVPDLVPLTSDQRIPAEVRELAKTALWKIAIAVRNDDSLSVPMPVVSQSVDLASKGAFFARAALIELGPKIMPQLLELLKRSPGRTRDTVSELLFAVDSKAENSAPQLISYLESSDDDLRLHAVTLLARSSIFNQESLPRLVTRLDDLSKQVREAALDALRRAAEKPSLKLQGDSVPVLLRIFQQSPKSEREALAPILWRLLPEEAEPQLLALAQTPDAALKADVIAVLAAIPDRSREVFQLYSSAALSGSPNLQLAGIKALRSEGGRLKEVIRILASVLKQSASLKDIELRQLLVLESSRTVSTLRPGSPAQVLAPYFSEALGYPELAEGERARLEPQNYPAVKALVAIGRTSSAIALKALSASDPLRRTRASAVLGQIQPPEKGVTRTLTLALKDRDARVRESAKNALISLGSPGVADLKRGLKEEGAAKLAAAEALYSIAPHEDSSLPVLLQGLKLADCGKRVEIVGLLKGDEQKDEKIEAVLNCLELNRTPALEAQLFKFAPVSGDALKQLLALLQRDDIEKNFKLRLLDKAALLGIPKDAASAQLLSIARSSDASTRFKAITILGDLQAPEAVEELKRIAADQNGDPLVRQEAVVALAKTSPAAFEFGPFFEAELKSDHWQWAQKSLSALPAALAVGIIERVLKNASPEQTKGLIAALGSFGPAVKPSFQMLVPFLDHADVDVRAEAISSMLRIDPFRPESITALRRGLMDFTEPRLQSESFEPAIAPAISGIIYQPNSRFQERAALSLLKSLSETKK